MRPQGPMTDADTEARTLAAEVCRCSDCVPYGQPKPCDRARIADRLRTPLAAALRARETQTVEALDELRKWRVWSKGGHYMLGHAIDGDAPTQREWSAISAALDALAPLTPGGERKEAQ